MFELNDVSRNNAVIHIESATECRDANKYGGQDINQTVAHTIESIDNESQAMLPTPRPLYSENKGFFTRFFSGITAIGPQRQPPDTKIELESQSRHLLSSRSKKILFASGCLVSVAAVAYSVMRHQAVNHHDDVYFMPMPEFLQGEDMGTTTLATTAHRIIPNRFGFGVG